jgi:hypothetical protein
MRLSWASDKVPCYTSGEQKAANVLRRPVSSAKFMCVEDVMPFIRIETLWVHYTDRWPPERV